MVTSFLDQLRTKSRKKEKYLPSLQILSLFTQLNPFILSLAIRGVRPAEVFQTLLKLNIAVLMLTSFEQKAAYWSGKPGQSKEGFEALGEHQKH